MFRRYPFSLLVIASVMLNLVYSAVLYRPAVAANEPLLLTIKGDFYSTDSTGAVLDRRTTWTYNEEPLISPDNKSIIYKSTASLAIDGIKTYGSPGGMGEMPSNIWLLDVASNEAYRIGEQPADGSIYNPNVPDNYIIRSTPTWSPDGAYVAWTEIPMVNALGADPGVSRLVVYSVASKTTTIVVQSLPKQLDYEGFSSMPVKWGSAGLAVLTHDVQGGANGLTVSSRVFIYSTTGTLVSQAGPIANVADFMWMQDGQSEKLALISTVENKPTTINWTMIDPLTGTSSAINGTPELYSPAAPTGATIRPTDSTSLNNWNLLNNSVVVAPIISVGTPRDFLKTLAISPDGQFYAYTVGKTQVLIGSAGGQSPVLINQSATGLAWGYTKWRLVATNG